MEFTGLIAFPLTPLRDGAVDVPRFEAGVDRLSAAVVNAIAVLGSTGVGAYLDRAERVDAVRRAVACAGAVPVLAGISALRTRDVLRHAADAAAAGAAGVILSPMTYQPLSEDEVVGLYADVAAETSLPVVLYDNPTTTHVTMTPQTYGRIAALGPVGDLKIPGRPGSEAETRARVEAIRAAVPAGTGVGISLDAVAVTGLLAGCDAWHSVIGGTLPATALALTRAALGDDVARQEWARTESARLEPLWALMREHGSLRVAAAIAAARGWAEVDCLPRPVRPLPAPVRERVAAVVRELGLE